MNTNELSDTAAHSLTELIDISERKGWCTRPLCTTCGALPFRKSLRGIAREEVIAGLRLLTSQFLETHGNMFRLIISETAYFPTGGDLVDPLAGTPAGVQLVANINHQDLMSERKAAYLAAQAPDAVARRRAEKKVARALATAPHRDKKSLYLKATKDASMLLNATSTNELLDMVISRDLGLPLRAIGGLVYTRLHKHYRTTPITPSDRVNLAKLAETHSGHWKKLLNQVC